MSFASQLNYFVTHVSFSKKSSDMFSDAGLINQIQDQVNFKVAKFLTQAMGGDLECDIESNFLYIAIYLPSVSESSFLYNRN